MRNYMDSDKRLLRDFYQSKVPIEELMRKYRFTEAEVLEIIDGAVDVKAVRVFELVCDMYYGGARSDALAKFKELMNE